MTQRTLNYTYKLFQSISRKYSLNLRHSQTALDLCACGTDLGTRSDSHNNGRREVKIYFKFQFKYFLYISIDAFMM